MSSTLQIWEDKIIERIQNNIDTLLIDGEPTGLKVIAHPDDVKKFKPIGKGNILVRYDGSAYREPAGRAQQKMVTFAVVIIMRSLRTTPVTVGIYSALEIISQSLQGWILSAGRGYQIDEEFIGENDGYWYYRSRFRFPHTETI